MEDLVGDGVVLTRPLHRSIIVRFILVSYMSFEDQSSKPILYLSNTFWYQ